MSKESISSVTRTRGATVETMNSFAGKWALITGASGGLGLEFADLKPLMGTVSRAPTARRCTRRFQCTHSVPEDAGRLRTVANRVVRQGAWPVESPRSER